MTQAMTKAQAVKKLRELDVLKRTFKLDDRGEAWASTPEQRAEAVAEVRRIRAEAPPPYKGELRERLDDAFARSQRYRYRAGCVNHVAGLAFFTIEAQGDSWADVVADFARKREVERAQYLKTKGARK